MCRGTHHNFSNLAVEVGGETLTQRHVRRAALPAIREDFFHLPEDGSVPESVLSG